MKKHEKIFSIWIDLVVIGFIVFQIIMVYPASSGAQLGGLIAAACLSCFFAGRSTIHRNNIKNNEILLKIIRE